MLTLRYFTADAFIYAHIQKERRNCKVEIIVNSVTVNEFEGDMNWSSVLAATRRAILAIIGDKFYAKENLPSSTDEFIVCQGENRFLAASFTHSEAIAQVVMLDNMANALTELVALKAALAQC